MQIELTEEVLLDCFRCYRGGRENLGVKCPWWAKLYGSGDEKPIDGPQQKPWKPTAYQISVADKVLFECMMYLDMNERKLLVLRCGTGFKRSFRKCGKDVGLHHEVFRQQYQAVRVKLQKVFDEMP